MWIELHLFTQWCAISTRFTDQYNISDQTKHHRGAGSRNLAVMVNAAMSWCMSPKYLASIHWRYDSSFQTMHCAFHDSQMPKQLSCLLGALNRHPNVMGYAFPRFCSMTTYRIRSSTTDQHRQGVTMVSDIVDEYDSSMAVCEYATARLPPRRQKKLRSSHR